MQIKTGLPRPSYEVLIRRAKPRSDQLTFKPLLKMDPVFATPQQKPYSLARDACRSAFFEIFQEV